MSKITDEMETTVAGILDYPSVYMGGPSQHNRRRARDIVAAVYPLIEAQVRERALMEAAANVAKIQPYYYTQTGYKDHPAGAFVLQTDVLRALIGAPQHQTNHIAAMQEIKP